MEVIKTEHKITKVGSIPSDWEVKKFGEVFDFIKTASHSKNQMTYEDTESQIYNVHYGAIHTTYREQILDFDKYNVPRITDDSPVPRTDQFLQDGDLVIVDASEDWDGMGECVELKNIRDKKVIGGLHTYAVRDNKGLFAKGFAGYIFQNTAVRNRLASYANVSKVYGITKGNISIVPLVIPPLPEQQKIAEILSTVDEQISATERIIEKSKELKKGLMQKLFSEGIGHTEFKDTKIGRIPKDWDFDRLSNKIELIHGYQFRTDDFTEDGIAVVKINNVSGGYLDTSNLSFISSDRLEEFKKYEIKDNDVLMSLTGNIGRVVQVLCLDRVYLQNYRVGKFKAINQGVLHHNLIKHILSSNIVLKQLEKFSNQSAQANFGKQDLDKIWFGFPPLPEQQKIAEILSEADNKIEQEEKYRSELEQLKKGLMQQLLTGQKRVIV